MGQIVTSVEPEELRKQSEPFDTTGNRAKGIAENLRQGITAIGNCWGSDETGRSFIETYGPQRDQLTDGVNGIEGMLYEISSGLVAMADGYTQAENSAVRTAQ